MSVLDLCTREHLAKVLGKCQDEIIAEWRTQTTQLLAELNLDKPTKTDRETDSWKPTVDRQRRECPRRGGDVYFHDPAVTRG